jgi:tetratricopeptide (TPR) repeat protein
MQTRVKTVGKFSRIGLVLALLLATTGASISFDTAAFAKGDPSWDDVLKSGNKNLQIGETEKAIGEFQKAVKKYPRSAACHTALGRGFKRLGKISEAKAEFKCASELESNYPDAFYELGVVRESDKEWDGAEQAFSRYLELSPDTAQRKTIEDRIKYCRNQKE